MVLIARKLESISPQEKAAFSKSKRWNKKARIKSRGIAHTVVLQGYQSFPPLRFNSRHIYAYHIEQPYHQTNPAYACPPGLISPEAALFSLTSGGWLFFVSCHTTTPSQQTQIRPATTPYAILPPVVLSANFKPKPPLMMAKVRKRRPHQTCRVDQMDLLCSRT